MPEERATYLYCVVKGGAPKVTTKTPPGLDGAGRPRVLEAAAGYAMIVATVPLSMYAAKAIDARLQDLDWVSARAGEHEAVVEHASRWGTVIPMKLFTLFETDERAVAHVGRMQRSLDRIATRIDGCDEWGLRILFDEVEAKRAAAATSREARGAASGKGFLERKKQEQDRQRSLTGQAASRVDTLFDALARIARRAERRASPGNRELTGKVLLDAVFLVAREDVAGFKGAVAETAEELARQGFSISLTGPWPAYSFIGAS